MHYRRGWIALFLFSLAMINYIDRITLSFAIGPISKEYDLDTVTKGYLFSSFLWTYTICLIPMGMLVDRFGAKAVAGWGIAIWSAATALTGLAWSFSSLLVSRLMMGGGEASSNPAGARIVRQWIPAGERGVLNAIFNSGSYAGPALCALVAGAIIEFYGWRALFIIAGGMGVVWLVAWVLVFDRPEKVKWLSDVERDKILAERGAKTQELNADAKSVGLLRLLGTRTMWGLALTQGCNVYSQYLFLTWLPSYLQTTKHLTILTTGLYTAVPYAIAVLLCIAMGRFSDRFLQDSGTATGRRRYVIACAMLIAAVILVAPLVDNIWIILGLITISLTGISSTTSLNFALLNDLLPNPRDVGKAMGFLVVGGNTFGLCAPIVTGYAIAWTGSYDWAFVIAGVLLIAGATATLTMTRRPMAVDDCIKPPALAQGRI